MIPNIRTKPILKTELKPDVKPSRWWATVYSEDMTELTGRVEISFRQSSVHFHKVLKTGIPNVLGILLESGDLFATTAKLMPFNTLVRTNDTLAVNKINWSPL